MKTEELLTNIVGELAKTLDETLLPSTTISSLGLKLATQLNWRVKSIAGDGNAKLSAASFANAVATVTSSLDFMIVPVTIGKHHIRYKVKNCPFKQYQSPSLCSIMEGVLGGLSFLSFGYGKLVVVSGPDKETQPCTFDLYIKPTEESEKHVGIEYSRNMISLLKGEDEQYIAQQRQSRRKIILGLFTGLALSLRGNPSVGTLSQRFIESLSCIPEIRIASLYLRDENSNRFVLEADYGIPQDIRYLVKVISTDDERGSGADLEGRLLTRIKEFNEERRMIIDKTGVRSFASMQIASKDKVIGVLNIGWKSIAPISPEISEAVQAACKLLGPAIDNSRMYSTLEQACFNSIAVLNELVSVVDQFSNNHSKRVAELSRRIAEEMELPQEDIDLVFKAALIHDIGKINIPSSILNKPGELTDEEFAIVKEHPINGAKLISPMMSLESVVPAILYHHERLDGSGYPDGLTGDEIPLHARIIAVADAYDAMTAKRAYRDSMDKDAALNELIKESGVTFDAVAVGALIAVLSNQDLEEVFFDLDDILDYGNLAM